MPALEIILSLALGALALVGGVAGYVALLRSPPRGGSAPAAACACVLALAVGECALERGCTAAVEVRP